MTGPFILTAAAARDLDDIFQYMLEHGGATAALRVHERLYEGFTKVGTSPTVGHVRDDLADEALRVWVVFSYLIIYRSGTRPIQILRVIHGARDLPRAIDERE